MIFKLIQTQKAAFLFEGWQETMIWSCLQGVMGSIYADSMETPASAAALLGDFCFFAGKPDTELILYTKAAGRDFMILVPQNDGWADALEACYRNQANKTVRYAIKKEPDIFQKQKLQAAAGGLDAAYTMKMIDEELFWRCREHAWCRDFTAQYEDYAAYRKYGLGAVILKDGELVSGASSYSGYQGGIEIEIDTRTDYRRKGLAYRCGARLILECLERGLYPAWDAQNMHSVRLAEKLGYHFEREYVAYEAVKQGEWDGRSDAG